MVALSVIAAIIGVYSYGRKAGERAVEIDQQRKIDKVRKLSHEVKNDVNYKSITDVRAGLRERWTRK
tara:strand:- start:1613 stop:1813 length:201 start_codon:yes stop_codon:yes gene_type:complete